jgi:hypothetical protein
MDVAKLVLEYIRALVWPATLLTVLLIFRKELAVLIARLRKAALPGGVTLDFPEEVQAALSLSEEVRKAQKPPEEKRGPALPLNEVNARLLSLKLQPSPSGLDFSYYRNLAEQDPNLALAGLRMEVETMARNLAVGFNVTLGVRDSAGRLLRRLLQAGAITSLQAELGESILNLCNQALHGTRVSRSEAEAVIDIAEILREQYVSWLSWGFSDGWQPKIAGGS